MPRIQVFVSNEVEAKIDAIVEKRKAEGAQAKDTNTSSVSAMLLELGLRVYDAQMEKKADPLNLHELYKTLLESNLKSQMMNARILAICSKSPHVENDETFNYQSMIRVIQEKVKVDVERFFPSLEEDDNE